MKYVTKSFKNFMENLWGNIPSMQRKPSDGWPHADKLTMSSNKGGGGGGGMPTGGAPAGSGRPMMMDKDGIKKKKKGKNDDKLD